MKVAVYPGSFDPISNGHLDIIKRASKICDKLYVLVSLNVNKDYVFTDDERVEMVKKACANLDNVIVVASDDLVLNFARSVKADALIRGLRNHNDFDSEIQLFHFNHIIDSSIETILLFPSTTTIYISSSSIKELVMFGEDISPYVPEEIKDEVQSKLTDRLLKKIRN